MSIALKSEEGRTVSRSNDHRSPPPHHPRVGLEIIDILSRFIPRILKRSCYFGSVLGSPKLCMIFFCGRRWSSFHLPVTNTYVQTRWGCISDFHSGTNSCKAELVLPAPFPPDITSSPFLPRGSGRENRWPTLCFGDTASMRQLLLIAGKNAPMHSLAWLDDYKYKRRMMYLSSSKKSVASKLL